MTSPFTAALLNADDMVKFLESREPMEKYTYSSPTSCMIARFVKHQLRLKSVSYEHISVNPERVNIYTKSGELYKIPLPGYWDTIAAYNRKKTFRNAVKWFKLLQFKERLPGRIQSFFFSAPMRLVHRTIG